MTPTQQGWFLFIAGLMVIAVLLAGDVIYLWHSGGKMDSAFVMGMIGHVLPVIAAFKGGSLLQADSASTVSNQKRAELSNEKVGV